MKYTLQVDFNLTKPFIVSLFIKLAQWKCIMSQVHQKGYAATHISVLCPKHFGYIKDVGSLDGRCNTFPL